MIALRVAIGHWRELIIAIVVLAESACATPARQAAVPPSEVNNVTVLGMKDIRFWGDESSPVFIQDGIDSYRRELAAWRAAGHQDALPPANYLAISGGGENGAFGAGLLIGWTASGTRPEFKVVTGISTGALIAPFAFLGSKYDAQLKAVYTQTAQADIFEDRGYAAALFDDALGDTAPLRRTVAHLVDDQMLNDIADAYRGGRLLLIGTTNLDEGRPVIWDIGKIAASGRPGSLDLVRRILVASAAVPGAFPPVMITVEANGREFEEMHVDGGTSAQVFVYPPSLQLRKLAGGAGISRERRLYVIRNSRFNSDWEQVRRRTLSIIGRAIPELIQTQGIGDLYRIYVAAQRDHIDFNLASIPTDFTTVLEKPFDPAYMRQLFQVGYDGAIRGYKWAKFPPGYQDLGGNPAVEFAAGNRLIASSSSN